MYIDWHGVRIMLFGLLCGALTCAILLWKASKELVFVDSWDELPKDVK